jgi:hypothetical protein
MVHALIRLYHGEASAAITISIVQRNRRPPPAVQISRINIKASAFSRAG